MKFASVTFLFFSTLSIVHSQTNEIKVGFGPITGAHFNVLNKQFDNLNTSLSQQGYSEIYPAFNSIGVAVILKLAKSNNFIEFSTIQAQADFTNKDRLIPKFDGFIIKSISTRKLWEKKKTRLDAGLGTSISRFHFKLVDRLVLQSPFDTLLKSPISASGALDYAQIGFNWNLEGRFGLTYNTNWFKKLFDAYEFSVFINYSQTIINSKTWVVSDTKNKVPNFPAVNFSNFYVQFTNNIYLKKK